jgi:phenylpyruvate tautomerase PptA (4-oxalocrotonate tautomerase family)
MPLIRVSLRAGKPADYRRAIAENIYESLYGRIVERLGKNPGLPPQDIFLNLLEVAKENWSFGNGEAQYA